MGLQPDKQKPTGSSLASVLLRAETCLCPSFAGVYVSPTHFIKSLTRFPRGNLPPVSASFAFCPSLEKERKEAETAKRGREFVYQQKMTAVRLVDLPACKFSKAAIFYKALF